MTDDDWTWKYEGYDPADEKLRESLCTLGNGRFATRGAAPECAADDVHYPGTYAAGCYNRLDLCRGRSPGRERGHGQPARLAAAAAAHHRRVRGGRRTRRAPAAEDERSPARWLTPDGPALRDHRQLLRLDPASWSAGRGTRTSGVDA